MPYVNVYFFLRESSTFIRLNRIDIEVPPNEF